MPIDGNAIFYTQVVIFAFLLLHVSNTTFGARTFKWLTCPACPTPYKILSLIDLTVGILVVSLPPSEKATCN